jgi:membrane-associated phospholipid phosphatase
VLNVRLGVELLTLMVAFAALALSRQFSQFLHDWWFLLLGLLLWNLSGPLAAHSPYPARLDFLLGLDRALFLGHDPVVLVQHRFMRSGHVQPLDWLAAASYNLHLPEPYIAAYFLWRLNRAVYFQFAAATLCLLVLGFLTFIFVPAVPPWMASTRLHRIPDVVNGFGLVIREHPLPFHGTPIFHLFKWRGDAVAAFPSEHAAVPALELLAFSRFAGPLVSALLLIWVVWVLFVVVYLGEHWVTDVLAGWLYAVVLFGLVRRVSQAE